MDEKYSAAHLRARAFGRLVLMGAVWAMTGAALTVVLRYLLRWSVPDIIVLDKVLVADGSVVLSPVAAALPVVIYRSFHHLPRPSPGTYPDHPPTELSGYPKGDYPDHGP